MLSVSSLRGRAAKLRRLVLPGAAIALLTLSMACEEAPAAALPSPTPTPTATPTPTPSPTPTPTPQFGPTPTSIPVVTALPTVSAAEQTRAMAVLAPSLAAMQKVQSYHFVMNMSMKLQQSGFKMDIPITYIGDSVLPDRQRGTLTMTVLGFPFETRTVTIGGEAYSTNPTTGKWEMSEDSGMVPADPQAFLSANADQVKNLAIVGEEAYAGGRAQRLRGMVAFDLGDGQLSSFIVDFWVDTQTQLVVRASGSGSLPLPPDALPFPTGGAGPSTAHLTFDLVVSDFNKPVTITAPVVGSTAT